MTTLVIARDNEIVIYEQKNGMFKSIASFSTDHALNDDAIVQVVTAFSQVMAKNGSAPTEENKPKVTYKNPVTSKRPEKKPAKKKLTPIQDEGVLFKTIVGFDEWRTTAEAQDIGDRYGHRSTFSNNVKRAVANAWLIGREEPAEDRQARGAKGRIATQYKLSEAGKQKIQELREKAGKNEL
jgi:hypothetical protein